jgi:hypothetical protein
MLLLAGPPNSHGIANLPSHASTIIILALCQQVLRQLEKHESARDRTKMMWKVNRIGAAIPAVLTEVKAHE